MILEPGQTVTEIALPEGVMDSSGRNPVKSLLDVVENFRVEVPDVRPVQIARKDQTRYE
jgi:hypothetical protein